MLQMMGDRSREELESLITAHPKLEEATLRYDNVRGALQTLRSQPVSSRRPLTYPTNWWLLKPFTKTLWWIWGVLMYNPALCVEVPLSDMSWFMTFLRRSDSKPRRARFRMPFKNGDIADGGDYVRTRLAERHLCHQTQWVSMIRCIEVACEGTTQ